MKEDQQFSNDPIENEHLNKYIEKRRAGTAGVL